MVEIRPLAWEAHADRDVFEPRGGGVFFYRPGGTYRLGLRFVLDADEDRGDVLRGLMSSHRVNVVSCDVHEAVDGRTVLDLDLEGCGASPDIALRNIRFLSANCGGRARFRPTDRTGATGDFVIEPPTLGQPVTVTRGTADPLPAA
ncbi:MAG: hypothetical protein LBR33_07425 [Propionibacteriaceae bacterium]|jgi:hypothetical protein|nr:hypothetical protein [Propionibacteriaceae bacterium]